MFKKILLPVDLSDRHGRALEMAADLAARDGGELLLLHVVEEIPGLGRDEDPAFYERLERKATAHLKRLNESLSGRQVPVRAEVIVGHRAREIVAYAERNGVDLIVLTAQVPDPSNPAASWGSLSYKVGLLCTRPVLLVK